MPVNAVKLRLSAGVGTGLGGAVGVGIGMAAGAVGPGTGTAVGAGVGRTHVVLSALVVGLFTVIWLPAYPIADQNPAVK